jgi:hypothetical protein
MAELHGAPYCRFTGLRTAATIAVAFLFGCQPEYRPSASMVLGPDALTGLSEDSLATVYIDVADMGGSVVYLSTTEPFITLVDKEGRVTRQFGAPGEGPGDFRNPTSLDVQADTVYVWDVRQGAASMFDTLGRYLGRRRGDASFGGVQKHARTNLLGRPGLYRRFGALAVTAAYPNGVALPGEQRSYSLLALDNSGSILDTVWASSLPASANEQAPRKQMQIVPIPVWAKCSDRRLVIYDPELGTTSLRTPQGVEIQQFQTEAEPVSISMEGLVRFVSFNFGRLYQEANLPRPSSFNEEMVKWVQEGEAKGRNPSEYVGYTSVLCDHRDQVWLDGFSFEDSPLGYSRTWTVLSGASNRRSVTLPEGFRLMLLSGNRGYGVMMDSTSAEFPAWVDLPVPSGLN